MFWTLTSKRPIGFSTIVGVLVGLSLMSLLLPGPVRATNGVVSGWQDTGLSLPTLTNGFCTDSTRPNFLIVNEGSADTPAGTWAYNWSTGEKTLLNNRPFSICSNNGFLYATEAKKPALRYSLDDPKGIELAHKPVRVAQDGSLLTYALDHSEWGYGIEATQAQNHLWLSPDGGLTWQERALSLSGVFFSLAVLPSNANSIYLLTRTLNADQIDYSGQKAFGVTIYYSGDGGINWEKRSQYDYSLYNSPPHMETLTSLNTPVNVVTLVNIKGSYQDGPTYSVSVDGGRTFKDVEYVCTYDCAPGSYSKVYLPFGAKNLLHLKWIGNPLPDPVHKYNYRLEALQTTGNWQNVEIPAEIQTLFSPALQVADNAPSNLFLSAIIENKDGIQTTTWYSPDSGQSWRKLPGLMNYILPTSYAPLTLLGIKDNRLYRLELADADRSLTQPSLDKGGNDSQFFGETGHNLSNPFKSYWQGHGGLAQFGYPRTEPLREVNSADGRIYTVQYFERNRFEYHPQFAGTPYEVELGLLGNQLMEERRASGDGAFNRFTDMHYTGGLYFEETGHNLRNSFKLYWEQHGGLSLYGYPISEEFTEVNADNGQTYVVQYFERNRFEYHSENKNTQYEVLLGLLGNTLLKQKGWL